jgi:hypothetical protein
MEQESPAGGQSAWTPGCTFYLGTHEPSWLARVRFPLCVSRRRLDRYRRLPIARCAWVLDSGAFSELDTYGRCPLGASGSHPVVGERNLGARYE